MPGNLLTEQEISDLLRRAICDAGDNTTRWAQAHNIERSMVCDVRSGRKPVSANVAATLGLRRVVRFEWVVE